MGSAVVAVALAFMGARHFGGGSASAPGAGAASRRPGVSSPASRAPGRELSGDVLRAAGGSGGGSARVPASLRGTDVDGALPVDASGHFVPGPDALALFDYYLSARGEESDERIFARIRAAIMERLEPPADGQALRLLDQYLAYRERGRGLEDGWGALSWSDRLSRLRSLRAEVFGPEVADALFAADEARMLHTLARREVLGDASLTDEQRAARLAELDEDLPPEVRRVRQRSRAVSDLARDEARLRADGADESDIRALRVERFGPEAAERLEELDRSRARWSARVESYREARTSIERDPNIPAADKASAIRRLEESRFTGPDLLRLRATQNRG